MFGSPETTTGGKALKFYSSIRLDVRKVDTIKDGDQFIGSRTRIKVVKNKLASPFKVAEFDLMYGKGISKIGCLLDVAIENNIVEKSGSWFSYGDQKIGQGKENVKAYLEQNQELRNEIESKVKEILFA